MLLRKIIPTWVIFCILFPKKAKSPILKFLETVFPSSATKEKLNRKKENTLCQKCQGSGYKGRVGAYELLLIDRKIQNAISKGLTDKEVEQLAVNENSMLTLTQYGIELVKENLTTISEVIRVCKSD